MVFVVYRVRNEAVVICEEVVTIYEFVTGKHGHLDGPGMTLRLP